MCDKPITQEMLGKLRGEVKSRLSGSASGTPRGQATAARIAEIYLPEQTGKIVAAAWLHDSQRNILTKSS